MTDCPYCGKSLKEEEKYCWHCENDISKLSHEQESSKCFIATAAFGYPSIEIDILRDFRDKRLRKNFLGESFIKIYYIISPPIARLISKNNFLKKITRAFLKPIIKIIKTI